MTDRPKTPGEKGVRLYGKPALVSKWYFRRKRTRDDVADTIGGELLRVFRAWLVEKSEQIRKQPRRLIPHYD